MLTSIHTTSKTWAHRETGNNECVILWAAVLGAHRSGALYTLSKNPLSKLSSGGGGTKRYIQSLKIQTACTFLSLAHCSLMGKLCKLETPASYMNRFRIRRQSCGPSSLLCCVFKRSNRCDVTGVLWWYFVLTCYDVLVCVILLLLSIVMQTKIKWWNCLTMTSTPLSG